MSTTTKQLSNNQLSTLRNALTVSAQRFDEDAEQFREVAKALRAGEKVAMFADGEPGARAADRLTTQFVQQAADTRALLEMVQDADTVGLIMEDFNE